MEYQLEDWSVVMGEGASEYAPPRQLLRGRRGDETEFVRTSEIVQVRGNRVTTHSGTVYVLGTPHVDYVRWCQDSGRHVPTIEEPIKLRRKA